MNNPSKSLIYATLLATIFIWGFAWPISKIGLEYMSPLWYTEYRQIIGFLVMLVVYGLAKQIKKPKKADIPIILSVGLLQMALFLILINYGLHYVGAGRAAILVYTTPLWATPFATYLFGENMNKFKIAGLILGMLGVLILFNPLQFDWHNHAILLGNALLILSAWCWAGVIIHTRFGKWQSPPQQLVFWQMLVSIFPILLFALILEPHAHNTWNTPLVLTLLYNGVFASAIGYWCSLIVSRHLPVTVSTLGYLGVPIVGLLSSAIILHETVTISLIIALSTLLGGLVLVTLSNKYAKQS